MKVDFNFMATMSKTQIISAVGNFWQKIYKFVLAILLVVAIGLGVYIWQKSLSGGKWSAEKKQEYLSSQNSGVTFKEDDFKKALEDVDLRKQEVTEQEPIKDVFESL